MVAPSRTLRLAITIAVCTLAFGCNGSTTAGNPFSGSDSDSDVNQSDSGADDSGGDTPGGPLNRKDDEDKSAVESPVDIPNITVAQGQPTDDVKEQIEDGIRDQCDGELCLDVEVEYSHPDFEECEFVTTRPDPGTTVDRGTTVTLIAGSQPCEDTEEGADEEGQPTDSASPEASTDTDQ